MRKFRPVYAPKDFLEVISGLRNNNYIYGDDLAGDFMLANVGMMQIPLKVPDLVELVSFVVKLKFIKIQVFRLCVLKEIFNKKKTAGHL